VKPCLIFDLDGTLVDSLPGISASLNRTLTAHGLPGHSDAAVRSFVGDGLRTLVQRAASAGADQALIDSLVALFKKDYELSWAQGTKAYPGIHGMLNDLQREGFQLAVLSNKTHEFTMAITRAVFPQVHFAQVLGQQDGIPHKPHPDGALQIATAMGAAPENCIVIGDSTMDLETASRAGMQAIAVAWGYHDRERLIAAGATRVAEHPSDLPGMLAGFHP
jgi:phosphoglycolate phosphatase